MLGWPPWHRILRQRASKSPIAGSGLTTIRLAWRRRPRGRPNSRTSLEAPNWAEGQRRGILLAHLTRIAARAGRLPLAKQTLAKLKGSSDLRATVGCEALFHQARAEVSLAEKRRVQKDLAQASEAIDILVLLREKTQGNRTPEESDLLEQIIYDLQLRFVRATGVPPSG